jgi:hypothetical protein
MQNDQSAHTQNKLRHFSFLELVHSVRLERLGKGLAAWSGKTVPACLGVVLAVEASTYGSSDATPESLVAASRMEDAIHTSVGEPCSGF